MGTETRPPKMSIDDDDNVPMAHSAGNNTREGLQRGEIGRLDIIASNRLRGRGLPMT